jgi:serine/threonine protein phosphatase 1
VVVCAVGDVHGRLDLLDPALDALFRIRREAWDAGKSFAAVLLGDYIDRGPDSRGVLARLATLADSEDGRGFVFLRGNHEQELLDIIDGKSLTDRWLEFGGVETLNAYYHGTGERFVMDPEADLAGLITRVVPSDHIRFLRRTQLFVVYGSYVFVHAGLRPDASLDGQTTDDMLWRRAVTEVTPRHGLTVVHGHSIHQRPVLTRWQISIDTGAYATGALSIIRLEGADRSLIRVGRSGAEAGVVVAPWEDQEPAAPRPADATTITGSTSETSQGRPLAGRTDGRGRLAVLGVIVALAIGAVSLLILERTRPSPWKAGAPVIRLETLQLRPRPGGPQSGPVEAVTAMIAPASGSPPAPVPPPSVLATPRPSGHPVVELGAFASPADAQAFEAELRHQMPGDLKDRRFESRSAGTAAPSLVRSYLSGFATADEARAFCARLGTEGRACWIGEVADTDRPDRPGPASD